MVPCSAVQEQLTRIRSESHPELAAELTSHIREADQHVGKLNEAVIEIRSASDGC